jgi:hypothetical protein
LPASKARVYEAYAAYPHVQSLREIRHEHRLLAANAPRYDGIPCYEGAPIIAIDAKVGFW